MNTAGELGAVEEVLREVLHSDVHLLTAAGAQILAAGGKRLRPRIVLLAYRAAGGDDIARAVPVAAAVELLHTASLIHDDINDRSDLRRGQPSANARWGNGLALLAGDFVFVKLLGLIASCDARVIRVFASCSEAIVEGETLQMLHLGDTGMSEETYLHIVSLKTAALFGACSELGGLLARAPAEQVGALRAYGLNLGVAFQLRDDMLDLTSRRDALGKPVACDLAQGKMSLAPLYALRCAAEAGRAFAAQDPTQVLQFLQRTGALDYAVARTRAYAAQAQEALLALSASPARNALSELAELRAL